MHTIISTIILFIGLDVSHDVVCCETSKYATALFPHIEHIFFIEIMPAWCVVFLVSFNFYLLTVYSFKSLCCSFAFSHFLLKSSLYTYYSLAWCWFNICFWECLIKRIKRCIPWNIISSLDSVLAKTLYIQLWTEGGANSAGQTVL